MIISASRRTDIPAFYSEWFYKRLEEGFVVTRNPFNANQLTKIRLDSDVVDAIVLWTKNAKPMLERLDELDATGIPYYFQFTITPFRRNLEPLLPANKAVLIDTFKTLSERLGSDRVIWRYDPILFSGSYSMDFHRRAFEKCARLLEGSAARVVISFLDMDYNNTKAINGLGISDGTTEEKNEIASFIADVARGLGMTVETCAEEIDLDACGIRHGRCIDGDLIERISGKALSARGKGKDKNQRLLCGCIGSTDIGVYNTCLHGCAYCYANYSQGSIETNREKHDPNSAVLIGTCDPDELPFKKDQRSFFTGPLVPEQMSLL
jgi:hypothetical protein